MALAFDVDFGGSLNELSDRVSSSLRRSVGSTATPRPRPAASLAHYLQVSPGMTALESTLFTPALAAAVPALAVVVVAVVLTLATLGLLLARGSLFVVRFLLTSGASSWGQQATTLRLRSASDDDPRHQQDDEEELPRAA